MPRGTKDYSEQITAIERDLKALRGDISTGRTTLDHILEDILKLKAQVASLPAPQPRRVVISRGNRILADETYAPGEPIVIDAEKIENKR